MSDTSKLLELFRDELIRWNSQINLVSRTETQDRLDGLFNQCLGGAGPVMAEVNLLGGRTPVSSVFYYDLGSGGGFPGVIWHIHFSEVLGNTRSYFVEPREKRAWFLNRQKRIPGMPDFSVLRARWGEISPGEDESFLLKGGNPVVIISLKALYLDDYSVLSGLLALSSSFNGAFRVIIARYYPPVQRFDQDLVKQLHLPSRGDCYEVGGFVCCGLGARIVPLDPPGEHLASLVFSSYRVSVIN